MLHAGPTQTAPTVPGHAPSGPTTPLEQASPISFQAPPRPCSLLWVSSPFAGFSEARLEPGNSLPSHRRGRR